MRNKNGAKMVGRAVAAFACVMVMTATNPFVSVLACERPDVNNNNDAYAYEIVCEDVLYEA